MKKLKNKVFWTIFAIFALAILSFIVVFNIQNYLEQLQFVTNNINTALKFNNHEIPPRENDNKLDNTNMKFMDVTLYTILIDNNDNIIDIINHSNNNLANNEINTLATQILKTKNSDYHIGFLYLEQYSYVYNSNESLIIFDNSPIRDSLLVSLKISIILFLILISIVTIVAKLITNWLVKPVELSFERQKQFIADASHELKTPLSVIIASSDALLDDPKESKWLKNIHSEAERMNMLITDLLDLSITERKEENFSKINLSKIVLLSVLTFEGLAFEKNIKFDYDITPNIEMVMNENQIRQLIEILLDNAIKHSDKKGIVTIKLKKEGNITLTVTNQGEAIPSGEEEKIFERFYRADKSRNREDNRYGLGLAIAKNIVLNHKGKISAASKDGYTTFKVIFK